MALDLDAPLIEYRQRKIILLIGTTATGKTYFLKQVISSKIDKVLVYDINREQAYKGLHIIGPFSLDKMTKGKKRIINTNHKIVINCIMHLYKNGLLILDDLDRYSNYITQDLQSILIGHRHSGLDIIAVFHSLARVPPIFYETANTIILKKTLEQPDRAIYKLPNASQVLKAFKELTASQDNYESKIINCR